MLYINLRVSVSPRQSSVANLKGNDITRDCILKRIKIEQRPLVMEQILNTFYEEGLFGLSESEAISRIASICSWSPKGIKRIIKARGYQVTSNYKISLATSPTSENGINYGFLLLVHLVCADQQIHSEESKYLRELSDRANISQQTKDEMEKILAQDNHYLTVDYIAKQVSVGQLALSAVNEAQVSFTRNSGEDATYFEILNRLDRKVNQQRDRQQIKVDSITLQMSSDIARQGSILARKVGSNEDFEQLNKQAEINVQKQYEQAGGEIQTVLDIVAKNIQQDFPEVLQGDLVRHFVASFDQKQKISAQNINADIDLENLKIQISNLQQIGKKVGVSIQHGSSCC